MKEVSRLGEFEMEILNLIWEHPGSTVKEVHQWCARSGKQSARTTVLTTMQRLEGKGLIVREASGKAATWRAVEEKTTIQKSLSRRFLRKMLGGSLRPMIQSFLEETPSPEELEAIRKLLEDQKED